MRFFMACCLLGFMGCSTAEPIEELEAPKQAEVQAVEPGLKGSLLTIDLSEIRGGKTINVETDAGYYYRVTIVALDAE